MNYQESLLGVIRTLYSKRRYIIIICSVAVVMTVIISLFQPNYFKATTLFLAGSPDQANPQLVFERGSREAGYYGNDYDIDRILTMAKSAELTHFLVDSFNLYEHYDIDTSNVKAPYKVRKKLSKYFEIIKTNKDAIELSVEDVDKFKAAKMANAARNKIDLIVQNLIKSTQSKSLKNFEKSITDQNQKLKEISDTLIKVRNKYGIFNTTAQGELLTADLSNSENSLVLNKSKLEVLKQGRSSSRVVRDSVLKIEALVAGLQQKIDTLKVQLKHFNEGMPIVNTLEKQYYESNETIATLQERYKKLRNAYESNVPATILIEEAEVPIIKSRPRRSIWVILAAFISFVFAIVGVLLFEAYKEIDWKEVLEGESPKEKKAKV